MAMICQCFHFLFEYYRYDNGDIETDQQMENIVRNTYVMLVKYMRISCKKGKRAKEIISLLKKVKA